MAEPRVSIATVVIAVSLMVAACAVQTTNTGDPTATTPPTAATIGTASPSARASALPSQSPDDSPRICPDFFTPPPYDAFRPVPGISVRAIDKGHIEITNASSRAYYFGVSHWVTEENLVCGRGVIDHSSRGGRIARGATVERLGGSTPEVPVTVAVWANPCGEGCNRPPIGNYVVPVSSVEPPVPIAS